MVKGMNELLNERTNEPTDERDGLNEFEVWVDYGRSQQKYKYKESNTNVRCQWIESKWIGLWCGMIKEFIAVSYGYAWLKNINLSLTTSLKRFCSKEISKENQESA